MKDCNLLQLSLNSEWSNVREYLSSDAVEEEKKSNIMYRNHYGITCLYAACLYGAPDDIIKAILDIGGKELVTKTTTDQTALHDACIVGASYNIIKMLIDVGGKDLVMAKDKKGDTALHNLCWYIEEHTKAAEKINFILQVGDANLLLSGKNKAGQTPLEIATSRDASKRLKKLLTVQSTTSSARSNDCSSASIVPTDNVSNSTPITQLNQEQDTTQSSSTNSDDLSSAKDEIKKLTQICSQQKEELQLLKDSANGEGTKRKRSNEDGSVSISQSQSSKRNKVENAASTSSVALNSHQAEDGDDDAAMITGQLDQYTMLMSRYMAVRRELRSANARNIELKQEIDDLAI
eukprot:scaffold2723_cov266-Chaetoceros_neogracile.AAC.2